ncbi:MAG: purine-cytosine permease family protein [Planctomycetota bacterium]|jgi:NCS1 family nucleobase:cation symporter-1
MAETGSYGLIERLDKLNEFERQPVTLDKLQSGRHFAGVFAGEHVAATEFVIGALFVSNGARTFDVIVGLIFGNLLAVLSWALICAPIAVKTRLTLYWYLRRIGGPVMMVVYNILNAIMYCILAGAMITVSASAVRIPFGIRDQVGWFPTDIRFVFIVLVVGAVVVTLAILGFKKLAQFAEVCSPWMFLMFIAGALALIPAILAGFPEVESIRSFFDFWKVADARIWPGPQPGQEEALGFLHIASFAWICNLAMHVGLSDMALFRYARRASYGFYSAFGMYLGHYLAWICAGIMGAGAATVIGKPLPDLDSGSVAYTALGLAGALAVVIAGWTTANPTIYRAGLALQVVTPNWPRWSVTLLAGAVTTIVACSPFVFTELLDFVAIYGLLLMPVGAIVFVEHWIFPRIGLMQYWISRKGKLVNWPGLISWGVVLLMIITLEKNGPLYKFLAWMHFESAAALVGKLGVLHLFFLLIPVWLTTAVLYIILSYMFGAARKLPDLPDEAGPAQLTPADAEGHAAPTEKPALYYVSGFVAVASLVACLGMAVWVAASAGDIYSRRLAFFKTALIYVTIVYFVCGTTWLFLKEKTAKLRDESGA